MLNNQEILDVIENQIKGFVFKKRWCTYVAMFMAAPLTDSVFSMIYKRDPTVIYYH
jgi:hypothetical protein